MITDVPRRHTAPASDTAGAVLIRAAIALNSALCLRDVLSVFTHEVIAHTGAHRASVLLLRSPLADDGLAFLEPAASTAREDDPRLWQAFCGTRRVRLNEAQRDLFDRAGAVPVRDAGVSGLIPPGWASRFGVTNVVLVPLFANGVPCGLLAADYPQRLPVVRGELALLEALAELGGVAVQKARVYDRERDRARLRGLVADATEVLAKPLSGNAVTEVLVTATRDLLAAEVVGVGLLDRDGWIRPVAASEGRALPPARLLSSVPARIAGPVSREWDQGVTRACELPPDPWLRRMVGDDTGPIGRFVLLPLVTGGVPAGAILAGLADPDPLDDEVRQAAETLAAIGGTALERRRLLADQRRRLQQLEDDLHLAATELEPTDARDLPRTLQLTERALRDLPWLTVAVDTSRRHVRLPLAVERRLFRVVRRTLAVANHTRLRDREPVAPAIAVTIQLRVERRYARLVVTVDGERHPPVGGPYAALDGLRTDLQAHRGDLRVAHPTPARTVVEAWLPRHPDDPGTGGRHTPSEHAPYGLTCRERDVLALLARRLSNPEIAAQLSVSRHTVKTHVRHLHTKLGVDNRRDAAAKAAAEGLVPDHDLDVLMAPSSPQVADDRTRTVPDG